MLLLIRAGVCLFVLAAVVARAEAQFTDSGATLINVSRSAVAWGDYDNDGDLDLLITGWTGSDRIARVYRNDGAATFTDIVAGLIPVESGAVAWVDIDADGDLDIVLTGMGASGPVARVYRNASGTFSDAGSAGLPGVAYESVAAGDCDNDGDLDLIVTGRRAAARTSRACTATMARDRSWTPVPA